MHFLQLMAESAIKSFPQAGRNSNSFRLWLNCPRVMAGLGNDEGCQFLSFKRSSGVHTLTVSYDLRI